MIYKVGQLMSKSSGYNTIKVLKGLEGVKARPGMYLGNVLDGTGYHHMFLEVLDNSVDEHMAGHCDKIIVTLHKDWSITVEDNGRGIPVSYLPEEKMTSLEAAFMLLHAGGKFDKNAYEHSGGLHGVGVSAVNALSLKLKVTVYRDNKEYTMAFSRGEKVEDLKEVAFKRKYTGTIVRFFPDPNIFEGDQKFDKDKIINKLKELSYLCKGLTIEFYNEHDGSNSVFSSERGISDFVKALSSDLMDEPIAFLMKSEDIIVDIALQWLNSTSDSEICKYYTNNIPNLDGGTHTIGFKNSLTRTINNYIESSDLPKNMKVTLSGDDIREGLIAVVSIKHRNPMFDSQTKSKLVSSDARTAVENVVSNNLTNFFEQNPRVAKKIVIGCINSYKAREAAKKAKEAMRKSALKGGVGVLPGKLADCQEKDPDKCELILVEGSSASGSTKMARNREFQAVLPLRGKVLNTEKNEYKKMMNNEELMSLVAAIGCGIGRDFNVDNLRYGKIILCCDADVDGEHISMLLLTFLFRQMPHLIVNGNVYLAQPPLFRLDYRGTANYFASSSEVDAFVKEKGLNSSNVRIQRFKGLGEMNPEQLWETTIDPKRRTLKQVVINDYVEADKVFNILMGSQAEHRKNFIIENSDIANLDI